MGSRPFNDQPRTTASFFERRIRRPLHQLGKLCLYAIGFAYPVVLVYVGLAYGGLAFWGFLAGSTAVIGIIITRLGYASNFRSWDIGVRRMVGVVLGFFIALSFYGGIIYLKTWLVPLSVGLLGIALFLILRRTKL